MNNPSQWISPRAGASESLLDRLPFERVLQITIAVMASLGTIVLGLGQRSVLLPAVAVLVAITSVYFTDMLGWLRLNRNVANVAAILAVLLAVTEFFSLERDSQLLAIANLLIYLQIVLMYQQKEPRIYWQLLMLSLLQVVVAAALNFGLIFGWLLLLYLVVGLFALSMFYAYRERYRLLEEQPAMSFSPPNRKRKRSRRQAMLVVRQAAPDEHELLDRGAIGRVLWHAAITLLIAIGMFFIIPRFEEDAWSQRGAAIQRVVGFDDNVELGSLGTAFQDPSEVMRAWFSDPTTGQPIKIEGEPLFRGSVLNRYGDARWRYVYRGEESDPLPAPLAPDDANLVVQNVTLMPLNHDTVFAVPPAFRMDASDRTVRFNESKQQLVRLAQYERHDFRLGTLGFRGGRQREIVMRERPITGRAELELLQLPEAVSEPFPELARAARRVIEQQNIDTDDSIAVAQALNRYLRDSGEFAYSLEGVPRNPELDPIEDFISNNQVGHCEYFSTALTLMLRTQGIPARMVIGFKGGQFNKVGNFYTVQQLHAHSWTEVYLRPDEVPAQIAARHPRTNYGAWLTLDPTPGVGDDETEVEVGFLDQFREYRDYSEYLWSNYVVGLDARKQRESIYAPITDGAKATAKSLFSGEAWSERWGRIQAWWTAGPWAWIKQNATNWRGWLAGTLLLVLLVCLASLARWIGGKLVRWSATRRNSPAARRARTVEFYHRLETILARQGIVRRPSQTQHEFALDVGGRLADEPHLTALASLPRKIVEAFYQVRFGQAVLSPAEEANIENALRELSRAMSYRGVD